MLGSLPGLARPVIGPVIARRVVIIVKLPIVILRQRLASAGRRVHSVQLAIELQRAFDQAPQPDHDPQDRANQDARGTGASPAVEKPAEYGARGHLRRDLHAQPSHAPTDSNLGFQVPSTRSAGCTHAVRYTTPIANGQPIQSPATILTHMTIPESQIIDVTPKRLGRTEGLFVPAIFLGLGTTLRHLFTNVGREGRNKKNIWVVQYPEQKRDDRPVEQGGQYRDNFRGVHRLNRDEDGRIRCVACFMCATACPADCIHIIAEESPWPDREKYPKQFDIDELRCIYCGMCEEACPCDAIELTPHYEIAGLSRAEMIFDREKLLEIYDQTIDEKPM